MLIDRVRDFCEPASIFYRLQHIRRAEELNAVRRRVAQRLQQPGRYQGRNVVGLAVKNPPGLLRRQPARKLAEKRQKPLLFFLHTRSQSGFLAKTEHGEIICRQAPANGSFQMRMEQLLKLVKTYRLTPDLAERFHLAEELLRLIEPDLRLFVFTALCPPAAEDVYQEVLKAVVAALGGFKGASNEEFWGWCYRIARNKLNDHFRKSANDRLQPLPPEELWQLVESSAQTAPLSAADRHDLDYALNLLEQSRPECRDFLWRHYVLGLAYGEIAEERDLAYDAVRMKIGRCLDEAKSLVA